MSSYLKDQVFLNVLDTSGMSFFILFNCIALVEWEEKIRTAIAFNQKDMMGIRTVLAKLHDLSEYEVLAAIGEIKRNQKEQFSDATLKSIAQLDKPIVFYRYLRNGSKN